MKKGKEGKSAPLSFHSGESRNLILATARIFREAEHFNGRLSANAASPQRFLPTQEWKGLLIRRPFCLSSPSFHSRPLSHSRPFFHSRESGNLPDSLTVHASHPKTIRRQGDSRLRGNGNVFLARAKIHSCNSAYVSRETSAFLSCLSHSIPAKAGISAATAAFFSRFGNFGEFFV